MTSYYMLLIELVDVLDEVSIVCHVAMLFCMMRLSIVSFIYNIYWLIFS